MLVFAFYIVHVLGGTQPGVTLINGGIFTEAECTQLATSLDGMAPDNMDPVTGRPVIMTFHKCVPMDAEAEAKAYKRLIG